MVPVVGRPAGMRCTATVAALALTSFVFAGSVSAEPDKVQYELQERCGKTAAAAFKDDNPDGQIRNTKDGQFTASYENHYSATFNKCFAVYTIEGLYYKSQPTQTTTMVLFDVNEHKAFGSFFTTSHSAVPAICKVQEKFCHSESEWREWIKAYMEN